MKDNKSAETSCWLLGEVVDGVRKAERRISETEQEETNWAEVKGEGQLSVERMGDYENYA